MAWKILIGGAGGSGFILFTQADGNPGIYADAAARDSYFATVPDDLDRLEASEFLIIKLLNDGSGNIAYQQLVLGVFLDVTSLVQGETGPPGATGNSFFFANIAKRDAFFNTPGNEALLETDLPITVNQGKAVTTFVWTGVDQPVNYDANLFVEQALNSGPGTLFLGIDGTNISSAAKSVNFNSAFGDKALALGTFFSNDGSIKPFEFRMDRSQGFVVANVFDTQLPPPLDFAFTANFFSYTEGWIIRPATSGTLTVKAFAGPTDAFPIVVDTQFTVNPGDVGNLFVVSIPNGLLATPADAQLLRFGGVDLFGGLQTSGDFAGQTTAFLNADVHIVNPVHLLNEDDLDQYATLNHTHTAASLKTGGINIVTLPTATTDTFTGVTFFPGIASTSNPTVVTDGSNTFSAGDIVLFGHSINLVDVGSNDGLYEVLSHVSTLLTIKGVGTTATVEDFTRDQFFFIASTGTITKVGVSVIKATDSEVQIGFGSSTPIVFKKLVAVPTSLTEGSVLFPDASGDLIEDNPNFFWDNLLKQLRISNLNVRGDRFETASNYIVKIPNLIGTTPQTLGTVEGYQKTSVTATATSKQFSAGDISGPNVVLDTATTPFTGGDFVLVEGDDQNDGLYEVSFNLGSLLEFRGVGGSANVEDFTLDDVVTKIATVTITKVKVAIRRTSLTGTTEHGNGDTTPIAFFELAHAVDVPIVAIEEFASSQERFFGELGLPSSVPNGTWTLANGVEITLVDDIVFGINKQIVRFQDTSGVLNTDAKQSVSAQNFQDLFVFGGEFGGILKCVAPSGSNNYFFIGIGVSGANNPTASTANQRFGAFFQFDVATNAVIVNDLQGATLVTLDGTGGTPKVLQGDYFEAFIRIDIGFVDPRWIVNGVDIGAATFGNSNFTIDVLTIASGSSGGIGNDFNVDNFGLTILEELTTKTISTASMAADNIKVITPSIDRDFIIILPDGSPRKIGDAIEVIANNVGGTVTLATQNVAIPEAIFNGENTFTFDVDMKDMFTGVNTVDNNNVYVGFRQNGVSLITKNLNVFQEDFELGNFNNWTVVNDTTNQWFVGAAGSSTGNNGAFISNDGVNSNYDGLTAQVSHFFKDVIIPKGSTNLRLQFDWRGVGEGVGENDFDFGKVFNAPTSVNPVAGVDLGITNQIGLVNYNLQPTFLLNQIINLGDSFAGTTRRFIFQWLNDGSVTNIPAWEIDNIKFLVDLDDGELTVGNLKTSGHIDFGVISGVEHKEGRVYYDDEDKALNLKTDIVGSTQSLGQEFWVRVINKTGATIADGKAVFINGFDTPSKRPTIALAKADVLETSKAIGFATSTMLNNAEGVVTTMGFLNDLDTSSFTNGQEVFLSSTVDGGITATIPPIGIPMGFVTNADVLGQLFTTIRRNRSDNFIGMIMTDSTTQTAPGAGIKKAISLDTVKRNVGLTHGGSLPATEMTVTIKGEYDLLSLPQFVSGGGGAGVIELSWEKALAATPTVFATITGSPVSDSIASSSNKILACHIHEELQVGDVVRAMWATDSANINITAPTSLVGDTIPSVQQYITREGE